MTRQYLVASTKAAAAVAATVPPAVTATVPPEEVVIDARATTVLLSLSLGTGQNMQSELWVDGNATQLVEELNDGGTVWKGTDGAAVSICCGKSIYGQAKLSSLLHATIDAQVEAPGHGKWWLDGKIGSGNNWKICRLMPKTEVDKKGVQESHHSVLDTMEACMSLMIRNGEVGAILVWRRQRWDTMSVKGSASHTRYQ